MGYSKDALKGASWLGLFRVLFRGLTFLKIAIIARLLTPSQFGEADIAIIVLAMVEIFTETGVNVFLIQEKDNVDDFIDTAWFVSIIRGLLITGVIIIFSAPISIFFNSPNSRNLLIIASLIPLVRGFINPSIVKLLKNLQFQKQFYYRSSITLVEIISTLIIIIFTSQPSGIIFGLLIGALWEVVITMILVSPKPQFKFDKLKFQKVFKVGKWLTLSGIFDYLYLNLDNIFIGRMLGAGSLGLYMRAYSISLLPITEVSDVINQSTFPIYVKIAHEKNRLKKAYLKILLTVSIIVIPIGLLMFIFTEQLVLIILGKNWISIINVLRILIIYGVLRAVLRTTIGLFYSLKKQDVITYTTLVSLSGMALTVIPFISRWGLIGAAYSAITGTILSLPVVIYHTRKLFTE